MRHFLLALQFLTVAPLKRLEDVQAEDLARSRSYFGLVGVILGCALALTAWVLSPLPPLVRAALLVFLWAVLTRFLHLDGLADTADALVHTTSRKRALEIMKDTHLGSFGLSAVVGMLLLKFAALASLSGPGLLAALIAAPALGRGLGAGLSAIMPPAAQSGLGHATASRTSLTPLFASGLTALTAAGLTAGMAGLGAGVAVLLVGVALGLWYHRRLGGVTGDNLGAAIEIGEAAALVICSALA